MISYPCMYTSVWGPSSIWLPTFFKIFSFVFSKRKKFIQVWKTWRWVNDDRIFIFGWNIPLRKVSVKEIICIKRAAIKKSHCTNMYLKLLVYSGVPRSSPCIVPYLLPSGRRYRAPNTRTARHRNILPSGNPSHEKPPLGNKRAIHITINTFIYLTHHTSYLHFLAFIHVAYIYCMLSIFVGYTVCVCVYILLFPIYAKMIS